MSSTLRFTFDYPRRKRVLHPYVVQVELNSPFWTSGNDIEHEGTWIWRSTGQPVTFTDWEVSQPGVLEDGIEHCLFFGNHGQSRIPKWHDAPCTEKYHFVCEKPN
ncbi:hypothetical protein B566_EDAN010153 [Ephemera danica]|nr:hypothetical protein B566_EDAN010153 [Ephemera danica]